jgi:hypothetical protein
VRARGAEAGVQFDKAGLIELAAARHTALRAPLRSQSIDAKSVPDGTIASVISMLSGVHRWEPLIGTEHPPRSTKNDRHGFFDPSDMIAAATSA